MVPCRAGGGGTPSFKPGGPRRLVGGGNRTPSFKPGGPWWLAGGGGVIGHTRFLAAGRAYGCSADTGFGGGSPERSRCLPAARAANPTTAARHGVLAGAGQGPSRQWRSPAPAREGQQGLMTAPLQHTRERGAGRGGAAKGWGCRLLAPGSGWRLAAAPPGLELGVLDLGAGGGNPQFQHWGTLAGGARGVWGLQWGRGGCTTTHRHSPPHTHTRICARFDKDLVCRMTG